ncbi:hypothetical protein PAXRUDRAFT_18109 [Paxillus rubicundulus Ve08.2h10]|uniref:C2H2-type domain-containing protein n=1 Tax=Paxillus rubicundulus Ve08.2h10 TaxID=930991 RepID=A0A0D0D891_9AGAM|nr:hypothetical protein PAXRUDRAFT_18109 [Paxillus rubicundulus Ve08.2h10]
MSTTLHDLTCSFPGCLQPVKQAKEGRDLVRHRWNYHIQAVPFGFGGRKLCFTIKQGKLLCPILDCGMAFSRRDRATKHVKTNLELSPEEPCFASLDQAGKVKCVTGSPTNPVAALEGSRARTVNVANCEASGSGSGSGLEHLKHPAGQWIGHRTACSQLTPPDEQERRLATGRLSFQVGFDWIQKSTILLEAECWI